MSHDVQNGLSGEVVEKLVTKKVIGIRKGNVRISGS
jgi:hypothetical protein